MKGFTSLKETMRFASKNIKARFVVVMAMVAIVPVSCLVGYKLVSSDKQAEQEVLKTALEDSIAHQKMGGAEDIIVTDTGSVSFEEPKSKYNSLSLDSAEDIVQSLYSVYGYDQLSNLTVERLYSEDYQVLLYVYTSEDKNFSMGIYDTDTVTFVSVKNNEELQAKLKEFAEDKDNNTGFRYKEINDGCILER